MNEVLTAADAAANSRLAAASGSLSPPSVLPSNYPLLAAFLGFALAQFLKLFTTWYKEKRWDSKKMLSSGGMPSSHSATVTALTVAVGIQEGTSAPTFAIALVLACVVMYDATGVRLHAGRQAEAIIFTVFALGYGLKRNSSFNFLHFLFAMGLRKVATLHSFGSLFSQAGVFSLSFGARLLNQIVCELPPEHPLSTVRPLRDSLGHTPIQVAAGAVLGCVIAFLMKMVS